MEDKKVSPAVKAGLWFSNVGFAALLLSTYRVNPWAIGLVSAALLFVYLRLAPTAAELASFFRARYIVVGFFTSIAVSGFFYFAQRQLPLFTSSGPIFLALLESGLIVVITPFLTCVVGWLSETSITEKADVLRRKFKDLFVLEVSVLCSFLIMCIAARTSIRENDGPEKYVFAALILVPVFHYIFYRGKTILEKREMAFWFATASLAASLPVFIYGFSYGHDWYFHLYRIDSIAQGLLDGQFPVRMNGVINNDYGYPVSIFYGDLLLYFPALLRVVGFTLDFAYKAYIVLINFLTEYSAYWCFSKFLSSKKALLGATAYVLASYRLVDIYIRTAVGEYTAMLFFPLVFLSMMAIYHPEEKTTDKKAVVWLAVSMTGLLYTHLLSVEMVVIIISIVALVEYRKTFTKRCLLIYTKAAALTLVLGASYWVPFLDYYVSADTAISTSAGEAKEIGYAAVYINDYFAFFRSYYGLAAVNEQERMQLTPGLALMGALLLALYVLWVKKEKIPSLGKLILISALILWLASNLFPWNWWAKSTPIGNFMSQVQFPWRYIGIACVPLAFILGYLFDRSATLQRNNSTLMKIAFAVCFLMCFHFTSNFAENATQSKYEYAEWFNLGSEYILNGSNVDDTSGAVYASNGSGEIISYKGVNKDVHVDVQAGSYVDLPVFCYPYYEVTDENGNSYEITEGDNRVIRIEFSADYNGMLYVRFCSPWYWHAAEIVSLISLAGMLVYIRRRLRENPSSRALSVEA